jgi:hypothetical protein
MSFGRAWQDSHVEGQTNFIDRIWKHHIKRLSISSGYEWWVIPVAYSLGSYISLELIRRFRENLMEKCNVKTSGMRIIGMPFSSDHN